VHRKFRISKKRGGGKLESDVGHQGVFLLPQPYANTPTAPAVPLVHAGLKWAE